MTIFLQRMAPDLAIAVLTVPLASYGLNRMFPSPNFGFLAVTSTVSICAIQTIRVLGYEYVNKLTGKDKPYEGLGSIFGKTLVLLMLGTSVLTPIFARYVGQRVGIQVHGYLKTMSYVALTSVAVQITKNTYELVKEIYVYYNS
jgi:hypothetical protein